jgi:peptidoglycan hydrolase CwlO-like protein
LGCRSATLYLLTRQALSEILGQMDRTLGWSRSWLEGHPGGADNPSVPTTQDRVEPRLTHRAAALAGCLIVASLLVTAPARADRLQAARDRLGSLERQIQTQEAAIAAQHQHLDDLAVRIARVEGDLQQTQAQLASTQQQLVQVQATYESVRDRLGSVTRTAYEQGPLAPVEALLGATSISDLMVRSQYLNDVQQANADVVSAVGKQAGRLATTRDALETLASREVGQSVQLESHRAALRLGFLEQQRQLGRLNAQRRSASRLVHELSLPPDTSITGAGDTFGDWAALLLSRLGAPTCQENLIAVVSWEVAEGTAAAFNPLATTHYMPGATVFNSAGVKNYPSLEVGVQATIDTLEWGATTHGYGSIVYDLQHCAQAESTAMAINASDWCHGCAGGMYVVNVVPLVRADYASFAGR